MPAKYFFFALVWVIPRLFTQETIKGELGTR